MPLFAKNHIAVPKIHRMQSFCTLLIFYQLKALWTKRDELLSIVGDYFRGYKIIFVLKGNKIGKVFKRIYIFIVTLKYTMIWHLVWLVWVKLIYEMKSTLKSMWGRGCMYDNIFTKYTKVRLFQLYINCFGWLCRTLTNCLKATVN